MKLKNKFNYKKKKNSKEKIAIKRIMIKFEKQNKLIRWRIILDWNVKLKRKINFTKELKNKPPREWESNLK